jgi:hypothetical protein
MLLSLGIGDMDMGMSIMMITTMSAMMSTAGVHLTIQPIQAISLMLNPTLNPTLSLVYRLR